MQQQQKNLPKAFDAIDLNLVYDNITSALFSASLSSARFFFQFENNFHFIEFEGNCFDILLRVKQTFLQNLIYFLFLIRKEKPSFKISHITEYKLTDTLAKLSTA